MERVKGANWRQLASLGRLPTGYASGVPLSKSEVGPSASCQTSTPPLRVADMSISFSGRPIDQIPWFSGSLCSGDVVSGGVKGSAVDIPGNTRYLR